jgi:putative ATP-dependent endonuclease of OLD family
MWNDKLSLEERAFQDLPWADVILSVQLARDSFGYSVRDQVASKLGRMLDNDLGNWKDSPELRTAIGAVAKKSGWFKDITRGDNWFRVIRPAFEDQGFTKTNLAVQLSQLWAWIENV